MGHVNNLDTLFLSYLNQQQVTPENIIATFSKALSRPDLVCLPRHSQFIDFFDDYRQIVEKIQTLLDQKSDEIIQLIAHHKGLDKRSYTKKNVPRWLKVTQDKIFRTGVNTLFKMEEKGDAIYKFTQTRLDTKIKSGAPLSHPFFDCCEQLLGFFDQFLTNLISLKLKFIQFFKQELEKMKTTQGICFFDDLVNDLAWALDLENKKIAKGKDAPKEQPGQENRAEHDLKVAVRKTYKACLIDEFQDTDPRQYDIFSTLFAQKGTAFFMIGDPKQAIYAFRGGDIFAYLKASRQCDQRFTLEKNYRSAPLLVKGVNQIFLNQKNPFSYKDIEFTQVSTPPTARDRFTENKSAVQPLQFCFLKRDDKGLSVDRQGYISKETAKQFIPQVVARDILALLQSNKELLDAPDSRSKRVNPEDIAVLVRTNSQATDIQKALIHFHIPSFLSKTGSVFDSAQAIELNDILCAVYEPDNTALIRAALCTSVFNFTAKKIKELDTDEIIYDLWHTFFSNSKKEWETRGFVSMIMSLLHSDQAFLKGNSVLDERGLTNFYHLVELISQACLKHQMSAHFLIKWVVKQLIPQLRDESSDELRLESDKKAIAIVTIHKSKGMEYPVVYLPYLWEGSRSLPKTDILFHDPDKSDCLTLDLGSSQLEKAGNCFEKEDLAEQRRLLYVAMTRASALCKIVWGGFKSVETSSLGYLLHPNGCKEDPIMLND
ncbi:MAG: UvrD-helicase domain-containing protein, partial [Desulfobacula sp.]|nr:UvrD-helicase domain-containing protein [Desulfobacula sp.]